MVLSRKYGHIVLHARTRLQSGRRQLIQSDTIVTYVQILDARVFFSHSEYI